MEIKNVDVEPLIPEVFAPYGKIIDITGRAPDAQEIDFSFYYNLVETDFAGPVAISLVESKLQKHLYSLSLEVHRSTEEVLIPLDGTIYLLLSKTAKDDDSQPDLQSVKAFAVTPGQAVCLPPGVWHRAPLSLHNSVKTLCLIRKGTPQDNVTYYLEKEYGYIFRVLP